MVLPNILDYLIRFNYMKAHLEQLDLCNLYGAFTDTENSIPLIFIFL